MYGDVSRREVVWFVFAESGQGKPVGELVGHTALEWFSRLASNRPRVRVHGCKKSCRVGWWWTELRERKSPWGLGVSVVPTLGAEGEEDLHLQRGERINWIAGIYSLSSNQFFNSNL